jgi:hypothetical protein
MHQPDLPVTFLFTDCFAHVFLLYYNSVAVLTTILWKNGACGMKYAFCYKKVSATLSTPLTPHS